MTESATKPTREECDRLRDEALPKLHAWLEAEVAHGTSPMQLALMIQKAMSDGT